MIFQLLLVPLLLEGTYHYFGGWNAMPTWVTPEIAEGGRRLVDGDLIGRAPRPPTPSPGDIRTLTTTLASTEEESDGEEPEEKTPTESDLALPVAELPIFGNLLDEPGQDHQSHHHNGLPELEQVFKAAIGFFIAYLALVVAVLIFQIVWACQYQQKVTAQRGQLREGLQQCDQLNGDFSVGVFSCLDDTSYCCHAMFCLPCRAGDTYQAAGIGFYWNIVGLYFLAHFCGSLVVLVLGFIQQLIYSNTNTVVPMPGRQFVSGLVVGAFFYQKRREMRAKLGGDNLRVPWLQDLVLWGCCTCCVVAQEARAIDKAMGVRVDCCCQMTGGESMFQPIVGQGVVVTGTPIVGTPLQN